MSVAAQRERALDLLATRALEGLDPLETLELEGLLDATTDLDDDALDLAAAELELAHLARVGLERPPAEVMQRLRLLPSLLPPQRPHALVGAQASTGHTLRLAAPPAAGTAPSMRTYGSWLSLGGWIAAAALILIWLLFLAPRHEADVRSQYEEVRARADALFVSFDAQPEQPDRSGDLVWDNQRQEGYMRLVGLAVNDPAVSQYQLWIFDAEQSEETPIDGGVFDVTDAETIVPIDAKLRVQKPLLFAITVEKPGGVPRSKREEIVYIAQVPKQP